MPKISNKLAEAIHSQTVAYSAFQEAVAKGNHNSAVVWAKMLRDAQIETTVEIISTDELEYIIEFHLKQQGKAA